MKTIVAVALFTLANCVTSTTANAFGFPEEDGASHRLNRKVRACDDWEKQEKCRWIPAGTKCFVSYEMLGINSRLISRGATQRALGVIDCRFRSVDDLLETILSEEDVTSICTPAGTRRENGIAVCYTPEMRHRRTSHNLATHRLNREILACVDWVKQENCTRIPDGTKCSISGWKMHDAEKDALIRGGVPLKVYHGLEIIACDEVSSSSMIGSVVKVSSGAEIMLREGDAKSICTSPGAPRQSGVAACDSSTAKTNSM